MQLLAQQEASTRSNAMLMGYFDSGADHAEASQIADTAATLGYSDWQAEQPADNADEDSHSDMPDLHPVTSDDEDDWSISSLLGANDEEARGLLAAFVELAATNDHADDTSFCTVAESVLQPPSLQQELDSLQERTEAVRLNMQPGAHQGLATVSPLPTLMADLHAAMEPSSTTSSQNDVHSASEPAEQLAELYASIDDLYEL